MKRMKMASFVLAFLLVFSLILSACGQEPDADKTVDDSTKQEQITGNDEKSDENNTEAETVTLNYWDASWKEELTPVLVDEFEEDNSDIKLNVEYFPWDGMHDKYLVALKSNSGPDAINIAVDWTIPFAVMDKLLNLDEFIKADKIELNDFYSGPLETATYNQKIYALPYRSETMGLFYNKSMFKEANLPDRAPETWEELLEFSKALTKDDYYGFGLVGNEVNNLTAQLFMIIYSNNGRILSDDYKKSLLNQPEALEAVHFFVDLYTKHEVVPKSVLENNNTANRNLFANEKVAMFTSGNYDIGPIYNSNPDILMGTALVPEWKTRKTLLGGWNVAITSTCEDEKAAWKWIKFLASTEISPRYSFTFPARKSASKNEKYNDPELKPFLDALEYAYPLPQIGEMSQIKQIVYDQTLYALIGEKTVDKAMNEAVQKIDELLK